MLRLDSDQVLRSTLLESLGDWFQHGFGTRIARNWPGETATLKQVHSDVVYCIQGPCTAAELGSGDALTTATPGVAISIRTADCVPILLADPQSKSVAAVHAGWKGTQQQIVRRAVEAMIQEFGARAKEIRAAIGPAIGPCCYEVSQDVALQFANYLPEWTGVGKTYLNLPQFNRWQLIDAGVRLEHTDMDQAVCTRCDADRFESFRRDGAQSGRMHTVIGISPEAARLPV
jgi:polyphenol oxidase